MVKEFPKGGLIGRFVGFVRYFTRQRIPIYASHASYFIILAVFPTPVLLLGLLRYTGIDVNTQDYALWDQALESLLAQRPLVKSYVMDEIYNMMEAGEGSIAAYYAGDYFTMQEAQAEDVDLRFYYPDNTNYFVDAMCIPTCCQNQALAEIFINYMLSPEPAIANAEYIWYASPNTAVVTDPGYQEEMGEEAMAILYPEVENFAALYNTNAYRNLDADHLAYLHSLWETLKIN